jgi:hypothetical protein
MTAKRNAPAGNRSESQDQAGAESEFSLREIRPLRPVTPAQVATFANGVTVDLLALTAGSENARYEVFLSGFAHGFDARQAEVDRLNYEAARLTTERDQFYFVAFNKGKSLADYRAGQTAELWNQAVAS